MKKFIRLLLALLIVVGIFFLGFPTLGYGSLAIALTWGLGIAILVSHIDIIAGL